MQSIDVHQPWSRRAIVSASVPILLFILYFVPKINVIPVLGFSVQAKPEDLYWLLLLPILLAHPLRNPGPVGLAWGLLLVFLSISVLWHPNNLFLVLRLFFYSFPLILAVTLTARQWDLVCRLTRVFLVGMAVVAALQYFTPFPFLHTGELHLGPAERPSGIYGNGVEFALIALFAYWLLVMRGDCSALPWLAALAITIFSGTRLVTLMVLLSGFAMLRHWPWSRLITGAVVVAAIALPAWWLNPAQPEESRFAGVDPVAVSSAFIQTLTSVESSSSSVQDISGYCFEFDDSLAEDQSLAMRLSKLLFVVQNVVLGKYPLGFGLGVCIGDAGDNLYVRVLSDAGLPFFILLLCFFGALVLSRLDDSGLRRDWRLFVVVLVGVSAFYDTVYFSRVAPLLFLIVIAADQRSDGTLLGRRHSRNVVRPP
jgi:hypothetical protein